MVNQPVVNMRNAVPCHAVLCSALLQMLAALAESPPPAAVSLQSKLAALYPEFDLALQPADVLSDLYGEDGAGEGAGVGRPQTAAALASRRRQGCGAGACHFVVAGAPWVCSATLRPPNGAKAAPGSTHFCL